MMLLTAKRLLVLFACMDFCARMLYDSGYDKGFTETCICCENLECDSVDKKTLPPIPLSLNTREKHKQSAPDNDDRVKREYPKAAE